MFHHRFVKQQEALALSLSLIYRFVEGFSLPLLCRLSVCGRFSFASSFVVLSFFRGFFFSSSSSVHRSSEAFIFTSFFVYFVYERLVVVGQQGDPIVAAYQ